MFGGGTVIVRVDGAFLFSSASHTCQAVSEEFDGLGGSRGIAAWRGNGKEVFVLVWSSVLHVNAPLPAIGVLFPALTSNIQVS